MWRDRLQELLSGLRRGSAVGRARKQADACALFKRLDLVAEGVAPSFAAALEKLRSWATAITPEYR